MALRLVVQPESNLDIQAAAVWYEDQRSGLGTRFIDELDQVFRRIAGNPGQFPCLETRCAVCCSAISPMARTSMWKKGASTCWPFCTCIDILRYGKVETSRVLKQSANAKAVNRPS